MVAQPRPGSQSVRFKTEWVESDQPGLGVSIACKLLWSKTAVEAAVPAAVSGFAGGTPATTVKTKSRHAVILREVLGPPRGLPRSKETNYKSLDNDRSELDTMTRD